MIKGDALYEATKIAAARADLQDDLAARGYPISGLKSFCPGGAGQHETGQQPMAKNIHVSQTVPLVEAFRSQTPNKAAS
ncbi:hypothetical protein [Acidocella sp.]|uniref:hypothetical protein n=1 Tax=Acidocella sp. TaxID=50710 RepID=UPI00260EF80E|nr:hypothetical protein [Acidocella sp.]